MEYEISIIVKLQQSGGTYVKSLFTEDHEWVELDGETVTIGISTHAAR